MAVKTSNPRSLIREDVGKWGRNALIFLAPAVLAFLTTLANSVPNEAVWGVAVLYALNLLTDAFRKWWSKNKYK